MNITPNFAPLHHPIEVGGAVQVQPGGGARVVVQREQQQQTLKYQGIAADLHPKKEAVCTGPCTTGAENSSAPPVQGETCTNCTKNGKRGSE